MINQKNEKDCKLKKFQYDKYLGKNIKLVHTFGEKMFKIKMAQQIYDIQLAWKSENFFV